MSKILNTFLFFLSVTFVFGSKSDLSESLLSKKKPVKSYTAPLPKDEAKLTKEEQEQARSFALSKVLSLASPQINYLCRRLEKCKWDDKNCIFDNKWEWEHALAAAHLFNPSLSDSKRRELVNALPFAGHCFDIRYGLPSLKPSVPQIGYLRSILGAFGTYGTHNFYLNIDASALSRKKSTNIGAFQFQRTRLVTVLVENLAEGQSLDSLLPKSYKLDAKKDSEETLATYIRIPMWTYQHRQQNFAVTVYAKVPQGRDDDYVEEEYVDIAAATKVLSKVLAANLEAAEQYERLGGDKLLEGKGELSQETISSHVYAKLLADEKLSDDERLILVKYLQDASACSGRSFLEHQDALINAYPPTFVIVNDVGKLDKSAGLLRSTTNSQFVQKILENEHYNARSSILLLQSYTDKKESVWPESFKVFEPAGKEKFSVKIFRRVATATSPEDEFVSAAYTRI